MCIGQIRISNNALSVKSTQYICETQEILRLREYPLPHSWPMEHMSRVKKGEECGEVTKLA